MSMRRRLKLPLLSFQLEFCRLQIGLLFKVVIDPVIVEI